VTNSRTIDRKKGDIAVDPDFHCSEAHDLWATPNFALEQRLQVWIA